MNIPLRKSVLLSALCLSLSTLAYSLDHEILGYLEPERSLDINFPETGVIGEINVKEGQSVKSGDVLASMNNDVLLAQLDSAKAQAEITDQITMAKADFSVASERYNKLYKLKRSGTAHSGEVSRALAEKQKAESSLNLAHHEKRIAGLRVKEIEAQISRRVLKSPIDGVIVEINRDLGESVSGAGQDDKPVVKLSKIDNLLLVVHVPAIYKDQLQVGKIMAVRILDQSSISEDRETSGEEVNGTIEFVSPESDPASETIRTRLLIGNKDLKFRSGSHALLLLKSLSFSRASE